MAEADKDLRAFMDHIKFLEKKIHLLTRENQRLRAAMELVHQTPPPAVDLTDEHVADLIRQERENLQAAKDAENPA
jgi:hypothetical protein